MTVRRTGAFWEGGECRFVVWAPLQERLALRIVSSGSREIALSRDEWGYWEGTGRLPAGSRYGYLLDGRTLRPDPCSFYQPEGVHAPSEVVDHGAYRWGDGEWRGRALRELAIYELHVGTFTPEGTFAAILPRLEALRELGVNAIELMPVAQYPGERGWGYDGVYPYAVHSCYGGPQALKALVDACHRRGMAVILDVVYNHLGPEGNYLRDYGPYFTPRYQTPWGEAVNLDGPHSGPVRHYFIANALYWFERFHLDGLRLDAVHAMYDFGAKHFLQELAEAVEELSRRDGRRRLLIAESDLNDVRLIRPPAAGGYGLDGQWNEDFHHALHTLLTGERASYYEDFGRVEQMEAVLRGGFYYGWRYSRFRRRRFGSPDTRGCRPSQFVVYAQNHDQVGNRLRGDRLSRLLPLEGLKLAAAAVVLSPFVPMLFMGEEYGERNPFAYFTSHGDPQLAQATREGRKREFSAFGWQEEPPDPQDPATFSASRLDWDRREEGEQRTLLDFYRELFRLRRRLPALRQLDRSQLSTAGLEEKRLLVFLRRYRRSAAVGILHFGRRETSWRAALPGGAEAGWTTRPRRSDRPPAGASSGGEDDVRRSGQPWPKASIGSGSAGGAAAAAPGGRRSASSHDVFVKVLDSAEPRWRGPGSALPQVLESGAGLVLKPYQFALYRLFG